MENQYNRLCTRCYLYRTTLFTRYLSPHKNSLPGNPFFHQGTAENIRLVTLPVYCVLFVWKLFISGHIRVHYKWFKLIFCFCASELQVSSFRNMFGCSNLFRVRWTFLIPANGLTKQCDNLRIFLNIPASDPTYNLRRNCWNFSFVQSWNFKASWISSPSFPSRLVYFL